MSPSARIRLLGLAGLLATACSSRSTSATSSAVPTAAPTPSTTSGLQDTAPVAASNPLGLPPAKVALEAGRRVFTFSDEMLAAARPGATLALSGATIAGVEGDDLIIEGHERPSYKVHPGYVIPVPDAPKLRIGEPVLAEHDGLMRHAVVRSFVKERALVRFTDIPGRAREAQLLMSSGPPRPGTTIKAARLVPQVEGFAPGNYAALRRGDEWTHVLLVSSWADAGARRWFALGFGGAAMVVDEADLKPIPIKIHPKLGAVVWAESAGTMRRATVQAIDEPGLFTVKFERAGRPASSGWGLMMVPLTR